jgi:hypothetical protein
MVRWFRNRRHWTDEVGYKSPQEIALENAADSLGATLGEYYVEGLDLRPSDLEEGGGAGARIDAAREELLAYARGLNAKRKYRRRARRLRVAACILVLFAAGLAGMTVLSDGGIGDRAMKGERGPRPGGPRAALSAQPPIGTSVSSELPDRHGKMINSTYLNRFGDMCSALVEFRDGISERHHPGGCVPTALMATAFRRQPAFVASIVVLERKIVIRGYARTDVKRIAGRSRFGGVEVAIAPTWIPGGSDQARRRPVKTFLVRVRRGGSVTRVKGDPLRSTLDDRNYNLVAQLRDGRVVPFGRMSLLEPDDAPRLLDPIATVSTERQHRPQDAKHRSE